MFQMFWSENVGQNMHKSVIFLENDFFIIR